MDGINYTGVPVKRAGRVYNGGLATKLMPCCLIGAQKNLQSPFRTAGFA